MLERDHPHLWYKDLTVSAWWTAWQARAALSSRADGGKGEAVAYVFPVVGSGATDLQGNPGVTIDAPQAECAPRDSNESAYQRGYLDGMAKGKRDAQIDAAECAPREAQPVAWVIPDIVGGEYSGITITRSKPVAMRHNGRALVYADAAPTPERADADTAGAIDWERLYNDMAKRYTEANRFIAELRDERRADVRKDTEREEALKKWAQEVNDAEIEVTGSMSDAYRCGFEDAKAAISSHDDEEYEPTPESDHAADRASRNAMNQLMLIRCVQLWRAKQDMKDHMIGVFNSLREQGISGEALGDSKVNLFVATPASQERADAGKDAALTDERMREIAVDNFGIDYDRIDARFTNYARAILAANKEKP
jgi:hypothetical protein